MLLHKHPHLNLLVYTTLERYLGRVVEVWGNNNKEIAWYQVITPWQLTNLWRRRLIVYKNQVVAMQPGRLIVQETTTPEPVPVIIKPISAGD